MPVNDATPSCPISVEMVVQGKKLTVEIARIELNQFLDHHHELEVRIVSTGMETSREFTEISSFMSMLGENITLSLTPHGSNVDETQKLEFVGIIVKVESVNGIDGMNQIVVRAASPTISMDGARLMRIFHKQKASDMVTQVVRQYKISVGSLDSLPGNLEYTFQFNETDYEFVKRMASGNGAFTFYDGKEFHMIKKPLSSSTVELHWRKNLGWFTLGLGAQPLAYHAGTYDYMHAKDMIADSDKPSSALSGELAKAPKGSENVYSKRSSGYMYGVHHANDQSSLTAAMKSATNRSVARMAHCAGGSNVPAIMVGHCVKVINMEAFSGVYMVQSVRHVVEDGGYSNEFVCIPVDMAFPESFDKRAPVDSVFLGRVTDVEDPESLGRVKIKFDWLGEGMETVWARIAFPHAGQDRGWVALPEIDDEVLVAFDRGAPEHPVIIGSLFNGKAKPPPEVTAKPPEVRMLSTIGGNQILFSDKKGAEQIIITTKDGANTVLLTMDGPGITVESKGDINIKGKTITLEADKNIEVKAGGDFKVDAKMNMQTKAGMNYQAEGMMVKIKGNLINLN